MSIRVRMQVTVPKEIINSARVVAEISRAQREQTAPELRALFKHTVTGWKTPPDFSQKQLIGPSRISMSVFASGTHEKQYAIVNEGSPPHTIRPRRSPMLRFQTGYSASTRPRFLYSQKNFRFGGFISTRMVRHPGFEARKFDETVRDEHAPQFQDDMQEAIRRAT